ncbi:MAG: selenide,water dikinase [Oceanospirillaceae bacterium]|jgi:selenide,water dikinase
MLSSDIKYKDIVLIGGGHSHAIVIKMWGMKPVAGVRLTLISNAVDTPYSGMLPGLVSGHYSFDETHIDLFKLCAWADVRFLKADVTGLDLVHKRISLLNRPSVDYDIVSINTGSTPNIHKTPGAVQYATGVKPIAQFYQKWQQLQQSMQSAQKPLSIALVGAGAGGFELILAMHYAWHKNGSKKIESTDSNESRENTQSNQYLKHQFHWIVSGDKVLTSHNRSVQKQALKHCKALGIKVHFNFVVKQVTAHQLISEDNNCSNILEGSSEKSLAVDQVIWCTAASAASWPGLAALSLDKQGFIAINDQLQSLSHRNVFAAGDVATQINSPRPKAGVFAVRQGPVLFKNLCRAVLQKPLLTHRPQHNFLSLLATGNKYAIASKGPFSISGDWVWRWKNHIDQKFMNMLKILPVKGTMQFTQCDPILTKNSGAASDLQFIKQLKQNATQNTNIMRCGGCGAKVASSILSETLARVTTDIPVQSRSDILIGLESPDDAAVIDPAHHAIAQSVDQFRSIIDDPYQFAKIATNHALSDLFAMGSEAQSALSLVAMPYAASNIQKRELYQLTYGIIETLNQAQCALIGGHTSEASELSLGLTVNGLINPNSLKTKSGVSAEQQLIVTKPLGTGVIMAGHMQFKAQGRDVQNCLDTMLQSNQLASTILQEYHCTTMTDLTGFGLIGHLLEMLRNSNIQCQLAISKIPVLNGALSLSKQGISSTLLEKNIEARHFVEQSAELLQSSLYPLLFDPQTSGGLLAWVEPSQAQQCLEKLRGAGYLDSQIIANARLKPTTQSAAICLTQ